MRVLITGAAGFIGSNLVDRLLACGDSVCGIDNFDPVYSPDEKRRNLALSLTNPAFRLVVGDVTSPEMLDAALAQQTPDVIAHLAARTGVRPSLQDPTGYHRVNVDGTRTVLDAAARHGVRAFVLASSSSVYGNTARLPSREDDPAADLVSPYAVTKKAAEDLARAHQQLHGGSVLCLRLFTAYGPRQRPDLVMRQFCSLMAAGHPLPVFGNGSSERDYTWVDDITGGIAAAIDRAASHHAEFEVINLGAGRAVPLHRLVNLLGASMGVEPQLEPQPDHPADVLRTCADLTKARELLNYSPQVSIEEGTARFVEWFRRSPLP